MESENAKILNAKGELSNENTASYEKLRKSFDQLLRCVSSWVSLSSYNILFYLFIAFIAAPVALYLVRLIEYEFSFSSSLLFYYTFLFIFYYKIEDCMLFIRGKA